MNLPKGIYHEKNRNRFRVRLFAYGRVVHRSYHSQLEHAVEALRLAAITQATAPPPRRYTETKMTVSNLLSCLT